MAASVRCVKVPSAPERLRTQDGHRDGFVNDVSHTVPFGPGCLFLVCFETPDGHRDGLGDDVSHTVSFRSWLPVPCLLRDARRVS